MRVQSVLVVDDEPFVLNSVVAILTYAGYRVLSATSPREALQIARGDSGSIDLLLTDVRLPGKSGPQLADEFAAFHPEARRLMMAGLPDHPDLAGDNVSPRYSVLAKPFTPKVLLEAVRRILAAAGTAEDPANS
jgi:two-component system, cell cycle sensor histidine kinase and response regulator CckA